ncbi:glycosyltransferase [Citrobacter cronae]|uniref:glycosyltransferase family 2 protein n=1 Tax=Citrobacter freundii complex TaxID=1344959 RepID=UPI000EF253B5|nr:MULTISPECIES: glycosyltransferase family 2 protein [Citrobacter]AYL66674.1 glycosyl transferase [Citrobacter werkmanii]MBJ5955716.1 glycosyltransferase family 2 protein [Salmonella enterica subsp. enterica serovar Virchow]MCL5521294.1 glycosyltransferase [Citrobacter cronae]MDE9721060.1 glycosyltransferase [Citrobacter cronae]
MESEKVSVIMPVYNGKSTVVQSIDSILNQTYKNIRLYIIDDCSTDGTLNLLESLYSTNSKVVICRNNKNLGVAKTRNVGIEKSQGEYIAFCDSDDLWSETKLEKQLNILDAGGIDVVCANYSTINMKGEKIAEVNAPQFITYKMMLGKNYIANLTGIYNAKKLGKFYQKSIGHEDYLMWLEILRATNYAQCIQEYLAQYRVSRESLSANKLVAARWTWNIYRRELRLSIFPALYFFSQYAFRGLLKKFLN